jgi:hypothetical protein
MIIGSSLAAIILLSGAVWAWRHYSHLTRLRKAEQLLAAAAQARASQPANSGQGNSVQRRFGPDENTRQAIEAIGLTQAERDELAAARQEEFRRRAQQEMDRYLAMSERDRAAFMQKRVAEMAKRVDQNAGAAKNGAGGASNGSRGNSSGSSTGSGANASASRGQGSGPPGTRGPRSPDQRLQAQKRRLDNTTPQERAQRTIYNADLTKAIAAQNSIRAGQGLPLLPLPRTRSM